MRYVFNDLKELAAFLDKRAEEIERHVEDIKSKIISSQVKSKANTWREAANVIRASEVTLSKEPLK